MNKHYEIRVSGHLGIQWGEWFEGLSLTHEEGGTTILAGPVRDQAELQGILIRIRDLGVPLISVNPVEAPSPDEDYKEK
jgi:hypothetical protein